MECTQPIECTQQEESEAFCNRTCPKQIGYLGICGKTFPLNKGPNKIGRDPKTCSIVLNENSISRHHAVINIINEKEFMVFDLGASNKTKVMGVTLQPYLPHPLKNGDTIQFGQAFGIFRLLHEDDDDLPMTQAVDIPETPVRQVLRLNVGATIVPESPDVSDRDDSIVVQPQKQKTVKSTNNNFIKSSGHVIGIQPLGTNKIDNEYWNSTRKSDSFSSNFDANSSIQSKKQSSSPKKLCMGENIFDMETQVPSQVLEEAKKAGPSIPIQKQSVSPEKVTNQNNIFDMETEESNPIEQNKTPDSIYNAPTQIPRRTSSLIHSLETQMPNIENLPDVHRVQDQSNMQLNLYSTKNENESQGRDKGLPTPSSSSIPENKKPCAETICSVTGKNLDNSDEIILFDEIENNSFEDCESQPLLLPSTNTQPISKSVAKQEKVVVTKDDETINRLKVDNKPDVILIVTLQDDDETDCEDNVIELAVKEKTSKLCSDDDLTDCEDNVSNDKQNEPNKSRNNNVGNCKSDKQTIKVNDKPKTPDDDVTDCEDDDIIEISQNRTKTGLDDFENLPTQVIEEVHTSDVPFEDMLTQVIQQCPNENIHLQGKKDTNNPLPSEDLETQVIELDEELFKAPLTKNNDYFKVPVSSPKLKRKSASEMKNSNTPKKTLPVQTSLLEEDDPNYYAATQEIFDDLCSQMEPNNVGRERASEVINGNKKIVSSASNQKTEEIRAKTSPSRKNCDDRSTAKISPKIFTPSKIISMDVPSSQEIDSCNFILKQLPDADPGLDPFEDSQVLDDIEERPSNFPRRKKRDVKQNLLKKFDVNTLPTRAITRIRKPTSKMIDSDDASKKKSEKILQSRLGLDNKHELDSELIQSNLARLLKKAEFKQRPSNIPPISKPSNDSEKLQKIDNGHHKPKEKYEERKEKELKLKQPTIKAMLEEAKTKDTDNVNERNPELSSKHHNSRSKTRNKDDKTKSVITDKSERKVESRERIQNGSRTCKTTSEVKTEIVDLTIHKKEPVLRRSRRKQADQDMESNKSEKEHKNNWKSKESKTDHDQNNARDPSNNLVDTTKSIRNTRSSKRKPAAQDTNEKSHIENYTNHNQNKTHDSIPERSKHASKSGENKSGNNQSHKERKSSRNHTKTRNSKQVIDKSSESNMSVNGDQSTVYDLSSEKSDTSREDTNPFKIPKVPSRNTTPNNDLEPTSRTSERIKYAITLKRQASNSIGSSRSKRSKTSTDKITMEGSSTRGIKNHYVLFTAFPVESVKDKLEKFGAHIVDDVRMATVVLTLQIKRTFKLLCAIGLGKPIVGPNWVQACVDSGMIVDPWLYLLQDEQSEKRFGFNLAQSLTCPRNFLAGCNISCTPNVLPRPQELQTIIECSGGTWMEGGSRWYCISCPEDKQLIPALKQRGANVVSNEFALTGVLRQKLFAKPLK